MAKDVLNLVEAAYRPHADDQAWFDGILDAASFMGCCYGHVIDRSPLTGMITYSARGSHDAAAAERQPALLAQATKLLPPGFTWRHHLPAPPVEHLVRRERRMARAFSMERDWLQSLKGRQQHPVDNRMIDSTTIFAGDVEGSKAMVLAIMDRAPPSPRERSLLSKVSAHLTAALRLRSLLGSESAAVMAPSGRILDMDQTAAPHRTSLVEAVAALERSRSRPRRTSPEEAVELWKAMVEGRWSLVEFIDSDGKKMILAKENPPHVRDVRALARIERFVVGYVALGHSNKEVGYALGLAPSTVGTHLGHALRKLGLRSRNQLIQLFGPLTAARE